MSGSEQRPPRAQGLAASADVCATCSHPRPFHVGAGRCRAYGCHCGGFSDPVERDAA